MTQFMRKALTVAGSDSSGGAGIQADLKTFSAHGIYGMSVITAVTAQNTQSILAVQDINPDIVAKQIDAIFQDIDVDAVKIGMVSQVEIIRTIAEKLKEYKAGNIVLDPVMISTSGHPLLDPEAMETLVRELIPLSTVVTPNIPEAEKIANMRICTLDDMKKAAETIYKMGPGNVLVKGGHLQGDSTDVLYDGKKMAFLKAERINTKNTHGTGCTLSAAIASNLALGLDIKNAVEKSKNYITMAIANSLPIGKGAGPVHHFHDIYRKAGMMDD